MSWYSTLLTDTTSAGIMTGVAASGALGMLLGSIRIRGISLGVAGALFGGIAWNLLVWAPKSGDAPTSAHGGHHLTIEFLREFGLILFVYAIGLTVGPGFFDRMRAQGLRWNLLAVLTIGLGCLVTALCWWLFALPGPLAVGLMAGATTNTPSLAAASQALGGMENATDAIDRAAAGYAIAYPLGIVGIILTLLLLKRVAKPDPTGAAATAEQPALERRGLRITNPGVVGLSLHTLTERSGGVLVSRLRRGGEMIAPQADVILESDDHLLGVGTVHALDRLESWCGGRSDLDLMALGPALQVRHVLVSNRGISLKTLAELDPLVTHGATVTRINRAGVELLATGTTVLHRGDRLRVVGSGEALDRFAATVGDSGRALEHPDLVPVLVGILLGVILGSIPVLLPGMPAPLKLGLAGGPLLVALLVAARGRLGPVDVYLPSAAILFMKELGILLFLSCVGLLSGEAFLRTLQGPNGLAMVGVGALITILPILLTGLVAALWMRRTYGEIAGLLSGAMTDPPALAFAQATASNDAPARIYATVYPLTMLARIVCAQALMLLWAT